MDFCKPDPDTKRHPYVLRHESPSTPLGKALAQTGAAPPGKIAMAEKISGTGAGSSALLGASLMLDDFSLARAQACLLDCAYVNPTETPPNFRLLRELCVEKSLKNNILPWQKAGGTTIVLVTAPEIFEEHASWLCEELGPVKMAIAPASALSEAIECVAKDLRLSNAEALPAKDFSFRSFSPAQARRFGLVFLAILAVCVALSPSALLAATYLWTIGLLSVLLALKVSAAVAMRKAPQTPTAIDTTFPQSLPIVTIFVPLFREHNIANRLLKRLDRLDYPRSRLDICLLLEQGDQTTHSAITETTLPHWMRVITVPKGTLKTKPRAMNYAISYARGTYIGVYDAEDAPEPRQIRHMVARFEEAGPDLACLQGVLDYYNSDTNWLARCFTMEYAAWFRLILPGLQRLGFPVPLGGTTFFVRKEPLEKLGGWDAHNVTEDADLGIRLARFGYRTELINSVTEEEANCRVTPWIKQRSRWLKGFAVTYLVHMRNPRQLWKDIGMRGFVGVQLLFLATLTQFFFAPLLWTFWLMFFGLWHPLTGMLPDPAFMAFGAIFFTSEMFNIISGAIGASRAGKPHLMKWALTLHFYFPLATIAVYKGLAELFWRPFFWDKTEHGIFQPRREQLH